jgi:hypothetical protein
MKAPEYQEGPEARENFKAGMRELFQVPKKAGRKPNKATARKTSGKKRG